ncbi:unnamed protein product [Enterobius vermicularis]|uniref:NRF domain-containing protein n=1 Tax=Enterobius vermicularis TaxID=51028 RepID=A0A0N4VJG7_ENTVE|nr:unnamed protein product [Enterobius vermicularis]
MILSAGGEVQENILFRMVDASSKIAPGVFLGSKKFSGLYRECLEINKHIYGANRTIQGGFGRLYLDQSFIDYTSPNACATDRHGPVGFGFDICVPKTCSNSKDLLQLGRSVLLNGISPVCAAYSLSEAKQDFDYRTWIVLYVFNS